MTELDVSGLLSVRQAIELIDTAAVTPRVERRRLGEAIGLRLAREVAADRDYPPFDKSLMDGYAVRLADVARTPVELTVTGEVAAGRWPAAPVGAGEAVAVMTGAPLPPGADGVVPVEDVEEAGEAEGGEQRRRIRVRRAEAAGKYIAARGSDCAEGRVVLAKGAMLGAAQAAVAASFGAAEVEVFARPRVAVLGTGNEIVPLDQTPRSGQIRNSNNLMLGALLRRLGCEVTDLGVAADEPDVVREALQRGMDPGQFDALFVTGGMSMGTYDYVPRTLIDLGVELKVTKLKIKPGKPFVFGMKKGSGFGVQGSEQKGPPDSLKSEPRTPNPFFVFGLPGNPVAAYVCTLRLASRLLARLAGGRPQESASERWLTGRLDAGLPVNGPREFYQPAIRHSAPGGKSAQNEFASITPLAWKGSADVFTLAAANALIVRGEGEPPLPKGVVLRVLEL
jgi:molybdopterin molybdotransferase